VRRCCADFDCEYSTKDHPDFTLESAGWISICVSAPPSESGAAAPHSKTLSRRSVSECSPNA
jgi:hypothetical protein